MLKQVKSRCSKSRRCDASGMVIKDAELRGVASSGMICSMKELNLPNAPQEKGIMVLSDDYEIGQAFLIN